MKSFFLQDPKLLLYGFLIIFFASYGQTFFISLFNENIREYYSLTDGEFGLIYAIATTLSSLMLVGFAKLIDHIDLRIYSVFISLGLATACFSMFIFYNNINRHFRQSKMILSTKYISTEKIPAVCAETTTKLNWLRFIF